MQNALKAGLLSGAAGIAILAGYPQVAQAQMYSTGPGVYLSFEGRYMWNRGGQSSDLPSNITVPAPPLTHTQTINQLTNRADHGIGGKAMLGYRFGNNWDVGVGVSGGWLTGKSKANNYAIDNTFTPIGDGIDVNGNITQSLKVKLNYQVADFEAGYNLPMGTGSNLRIFGGVRYAHFNQKASSHLMGSGTVEGLGTGTATLDVKRKSTYWGVGPRIGANGQFGVGNSGFNVFGSVSGALLYGKFKDGRKASVFAQDNNTPVPNTFSTAFAVKDKSKNKIVPNLEGEIGIGYNFNTGGNSTVGLQLGYRAEKWWGVSSDAPILTFSQASHSADQLFHGPFVRLVATFGSAAAMPMASAPPPGQPAMAKKNFIVFFDFDKSNITAEAQKTINDAVATAKSGGASQVTLTGHTDRSGSEQYNLALSLRRAESVKANMIKQGVPASLIVVVGKGESQPLVPTADGVREPQNRRVEIVI